MEMKSRQQEKLGWTLGWLGGFVWVPILSLIFLFDHRTVEAGIGLLITAAAGAAIVWLAPWRHPQTRYRVLMVPIYLMFAAAIGWGVWSIDDPQQMGINSGWSALVLLPCLLPFWVVGARRWNDPGPSPTRE